jgi:hypothetical protein
VSEIVQQIRHQRVGQNGDDLSVKLCHNIVGGDGRQSAALAQRVDAFTGRAEESGGLGYVHQDREAVHVVRRFSSHTLAARRPQDCTALLSGPRLCGLPTRCQACRVSAVLSRRRIEPDAGRRERSLSLKLAAILPRCFAPAVPSDTSPPAGLRLQTSVSKCQRLSGQRLSGKTVRRRFQVETEVSKKNPLLRRDLQVRSCEQHLSGHRPAMLARCSTPARVPSRGSAAPPPLRPPARRALFWQLPMAGRGSANSGCCLPESTARS